MSNPSSGSSFPPPFDDFSTYPEYDPSSPSTRRYVLFHPHCSRWIVLNGTALEIAGIVLGSSHVSRAASAVAERYGLPMDRALDDVRRVILLLEKNHFLSIGPGKSGDVAAGVPGEGLPRRAPALDSAFIHLTNRCNLSCPHCYYPRTGVGKDLPVESVQNLIDELAGHGAGGVTLSGGEPLLHPGIEEILEYASSRIRVRLLTNGLLIDRRWAEHLSGMDIHVQVSVEGSTADVHDTIRGAGSFQRALEGVRLLQEAGLGERVNFSTTIMKQNLSDLPDIIGLADRIGVPLVRFLPLGRRGRANTQWAAVGAGVTMEDYESFFRFATRLQREGKCRAEISCGVSGFMLQLPDAFAADDIWCSVGKTAVIDVSGDIYPCVLLMQDEFRLGNILEGTDLAGALGSKPMAALCHALTQRRQTIERCAPCSWRNLCQAGCMGLALEHTGTIDDVDRHCEYRQQAYREAFDRILGQEASRE